VPIKRSIFRCALLALLFAITVVHQFLYCRNILRGEKINVPFFATESATNTIRFAAADAISAGVDNVDALITVDGVPYTGTAVFRRCSGTRSFPKRP
jgi:hypothetical protein